MANIYTFSTERLAGFIARFKAEYAAMSDKENTHAQAALERIERYEAALNTPNPLPLLIALANNERMIQDGLAFEYQAQAADYQAAASRLFAQGKEATAQAYYQNAAARRILATDHFLAGDEFNRLVCELHETTPVYPMNYWELPTGEE